MFKFKSYNVEKAEKKTETGKSKSSSSTGTLKKSSGGTSSSSSTGTLKKSSGGTSSSSYVSPKTKTKPSAEEVKAVSNYQPPDYSRKIYPKKTVTHWHKNKTYSARKETEKVAIPSPHKKLERK